MLPLSAHEDFKEKTGGETGKQENSKVAKLTYHRCKKNCQADRRKGRWDEDAINQGPCTAPVDFWLTVQQHANSAADTLRLIGVDLVCVATELLYWHQASSVFRPPGPRFSALVTEEGSPDCAPLILEVPIAATAEMSLHPLGRISHLVYQPCPRSIFEEKTFVRRRRTPTRRARCLSSLSSLGPGLVFVVIC